MSYFLFIQKRRCPKPMPNIKSAKKRVLVAKKKAAQNKAARSALKTVLKKANTGDPAAVKVAIKKVDQAVCKIWEKIGGYIFLLSFTTNFPS